MGVSGQHHTLAAYYPQEWKLVPFGYEAGWASELVWTQGLGEKSFTSAEDQSSDVQSVVRHYTDRATQALIGD
jgi:hypothetical protein